MFKNTFLQAGRIATILLVVVFISGSLFDLRAQGVGAVMGKVENEEGEALQAANVQLKGTDLGASTNQSGIYRIRSIPPGTYTLMASYIGYEEVEKEIEVIAGEAVTIDLTLSSSAVKGEDVYVTAIAKGRGKSYMIRRESDISKQILSAEEMERFGDTNLAGSLNRLPGISVNYEMGEASGLSIRGMEMDRNLVQYNGVPMASTDAAGRATDVSSMSAGMIESVEVIKVPTPDMPADAIGGIINIQSSRPSPGQRNMQLQLSGDYIARAPSFGPDVLFRYSQGFDNGVGISAQGEYRRVRGYGEDFTADWGGLYPAQANPRIQWRDSERYGGSARLSYSPNRISSFYLSGVFNFEDNYDDSRGLTIEPGQGLSGEVEDGVYEVKSAYALGDKRGGNVEMGISEQKEGVRQITLSAGGEHTLPIFNMDYQASYSQGVTRTDYSRNLQWENVWDNWFLIDTRGKVPQYHFRPWNYSSENPDSLTSLEDPYYWEYDDMEVNKENATHQKIRGKLDITLPYDLKGNKNIEVQFGGAVDQDFKTRRQAEFDYGGDATGLSPDSKQHVGESITDPDLQGVWLRPFTEGVEPMPFPFGESVRVLWFDLDRWMKWFRGDLDLSDEMDFQRPEHEEMPFDLQNYNESIAENYDLTEGNIAGYGMVTMALGNTELITGLRTEFMYGSYQGVHTETQTYQRPDGHTGTRRVILGPINESFTDIGYYPSFHVKHNFTEYTIFRGSVTYGMKRADYADLMPVTHYDYADREITTGNPRLKPERNTQIDFSIEHFFGNVGQVSANAFFNNFTQFIHDREFVVREGEFRGWTKEKPVNGEYALNYGLELSWVQPLDYLPGLLSNLGVYSNFTQLISRAHVSEPYARTVQQPGLAPQRLNVGLTYDLGGFNMLIAANYVTEHLESTDATEFSGVHFDRYAKEEVTLNITLRQRIWGNIRLTVDLRNILSTPRDYYILKPVDPDSYRLKTLKDAEGTLPEFLESYEMFGFSANAGIRIEF